ncbi:MAG TPA: MazG-like family protein [Pseudonocardiaceae bacterium]|nr:MazG-like family protein [Pseudonocardiaceae bacterium]
MNTPTTTDLRQAQHRAWANKLDKGFNTTDVALEFGLLVAEVGEAFTAWRRHLPDLGEELADITLYTLALAQMTGLDLAAELDRKLTRNAARVYRPDRHGIPTRVSTGAGGELGASGCQPVNTDTIEQEEVGQ